MCHQEQEKEFVLISDEIPYFPANQLTWRISRGQFLALKMRVFPYYRLISRIRKFRYLTTGTFFSFCNKVCQVCVTFITHQRMFFITTVKLILLALLIAVAISIDDSAVAISIDNSAVAISIDDSTDEDDEFHGF